MVRTNVRRIAKPLIGSAKKSTTRSDSTWQLFPRDEELERAYLCAMIEDDMQHNDEYRWECFDEWN